MEDQVAIGSPSRIFSISGGRKRVSVVHWFKMDCLRLDDNLAFNDAVRSYNLFKKYSSGSAVLKAIFIFDPWFKNSFINSACRNINVMRFFLECLEDLDNNLRRKYYTQLRIYYGNSKTTIQKLILHWNITKLTFQASTFSPDSLVYDYNIKTMCEENNVEVYDPFANSLFDSMDLLHMANNEIISSIELFHKILKKCGLPSVPVDPVPIVHNGKAFQMAAMKGEKKDKWSGKGLPDIQYFGFVDRGVSYIPHFTGGETVARNKLIGMFKQKATSLDGTVKYKIYIEVVSPFFRFGCLSVRRIFYKLHDRKGESQEVRHMISSFMGKLLRREYAIYVGCFIRRIDIECRNILCTRVEWENGEDKLKAFVDGITGFPWIDAIVRSICRDGWANYSSRRCIVTFFTHQLRISWVYINNFFQEFMLDFELADYSVCLMQASGSFRDTSMAENFDPVMVGIIVDPEGEFLKEFIPEIRNYPEELIHTPWKASLKEQKHYGCTLGVHYPKPIIDPDIFFGRLPGRLYII